MAKHKVLFKRRDTYFAGSGTCRCRPSSDGLPVHLCRVHWDRERDGEETLTHLAIAQIMLTGITSGVTLCGVTFRGALEGQGRKRLCWRCVRAWRDGVPATDGLRQSPRLEQEYFAALRERNRMRLFP